MAGCGPVNSLIASCLLVEKGKEKQLKLVLVETLFHSTTAAAGAAVCGVVGWLVPALVVLLRVRQLLLLLPRSNWPCLSSVESGQDLVCW